MKMSKKYQEYEVIVKENRLDISQRVRSEMKYNHLTGKALSIDLACDDNTFSRKLKNEKNDRYFDIEDLKKLSDAFKCRFDYLVCIDDFRTKDDITYIDKDKLRKDYEKAINYLGSIGIILQPGMFWYGTINQFENAKDKIWSFLTDKSQNTYKKNKREYYDKLPENEHFYFRLRDNPNKAKMPNIEELETKNISATNLDTAFICEDLSNKSINKLSGVICLRFNISFEDSNNSPINISVDEANKLFAYLDKSTKDNIKTLLDCNLLHEPDKNDYYYSDDYLYTLQDLFVEYSEYKKQQKSPE